MSGRVIAGIGCRAGCSGDEIVELVREASLQAGWPASLLAAAAFKRGEAGLDEAAAQLGLPLLWVGNEALRAVQPACITRSLRAERATGFGSVAEGAALAAAGPGGALILPRIASARATCALAEEAAP